MKASVIANLGLGSLKALGSLAVRTRPGDEEFLAAFLPEGLAPFTPEGREMAPSMGHCLACGACEYTGASPRALLEATRGLQDLALTGEWIYSIMALGEDGVAALERCCPTGIPFGRVVKALADMAIAARSGGAAGPDAG